VWTAAILVAASFAWMSAPALSRAAEINAAWNAAAIGNWSDGTKWSTNPTVPNNGDDTFVVNIDDGETTLDSTFVIDKLTLTGGALLGTGSLTVNDETTWSGGALGGVDATATLNFDGPTVWNGGEKYFAAVTVNLNGPTTWSSGHIGSVEPPEGGTINNAGAFDLQANLQLIWISTQTPVFNNLAGASFTKSAGTGDAARIDGTFNSAGDVYANSGEMWFAGGGTSTGAFHVTAGAALDFSDYNQGYSAQGSTITVLDTDSIVDSNGTVIFTNSSGDSHTDVNGQFDSVETYVNPGSTGEVRFNSGSTFGQNLSGTIVVNSGALVLKNEDTSYATNLAVNVGEARIVANSTLDVTGNVSLAADTTLRLGASGNGGSLNFSGGSPHLLDGEGEIIMAQGEIGADGTGPLTIGPDIEIRGQGLIYSPATSVNQGTIIANVPGEYITVSNFNNEGLMQVTDGARFDISNGTNSGTIESSGANGQVILHSGTNTGAIQATSGSQINATDLNNQNILSVAGGGNLSTISLQNKAAGVVTINGGTLTLQSLWDNDGTINATNATVELGGVFNIANVGTINRTGTTTVRIIGTLQNTAQVVALSDTTGSWTLASTGVIEGGTVTTTGSAKLIASGGQLDGVILSTSPTFTNGASLLIQHGVQLTGSDLDLSAGGTIAAGLSFFGPAQAIAGNGVITLGVGSNINNSFGGTVTFGPDIAIEAKHGTFNGGTGGIVIQGVLNADGQGLTTNLVSLNDVTNSGDINAIAGVTLRLGGVWHNSGGNIDLTNSLLLFAGPFTTADIGSINRTGTSVVRLATTLNNAAATLDLADALAGDLQLRGGTIQGGSILPGTPAARLVVTGSVVGNGTLDGVTNLAANVVFDPATNGDTLFVRNSLSMTNSTIDMSGLGRTVMFQGSNAQTLGGTGQILFNTAGLNEIRNNSTNNAAVTFGPNTNIHGGGFSLLITGKGAGTAGGFINQGRIAVDTAGSLLSISNLQNQGTISNVAGASISIGDGFTHTAGTLKIDGALTRSTAGPLVLQGGSIAGGGAINASVSVGTATTPGALQSDATAGVPSINGDLTVHPLSSFGVDLRGINPNVGYDQYNVSGIVTLTGSTLDLHLDFAPVVLDQPFTIISNGNSDLIVGEFANLIDGAIFPVSFLTHTYQMQINYDGGSNNNDVVLTVTSIPPTIIAGDVNFDGLVNIFDINLVSSHWSEKGPVADANGDNIVNIFDINLISSHWGQMAPGGGSATAAPEPSSWALAALGLLAGAIFRIRRRTSCAGD